MGLIVTNVLRPFFPDVTAPTAPVLDPVILTGNSAALSWSAATDTETGVVGYIVVVDGNPLPNLVRALSTAVAPLANGTHTFQVIGRDGAGNLSTPSNTRTIQIGALISINWDNSHIVQVGNENHSNDDVNLFATGKSDSQVQANLVISRDIHHGTLRNIGGFMGVYQMSQLEGPALGDYSRCDALVGPMVQWSKDRGYHWSIALNMSGNASGGSTKYATMPEYMNSTTYGPVDANGNHGAVYFTSTVGPITRISNDNTMARVAALIKHIWQMWGPDVFSVQPLWSELAISLPAAAQMPQAQQVACLSKVGGFFDQARTSGPGHYLYVPPTFIGFNDPTLMIDFFAATDRNFITCGNFDSTNETGGTKARHFTGDTTFRGFVYDSAGVIKTPVPGLIDRVAAGQDFATHTSEDALGNSGTHKLDPVPPARVGDGRLALTWGHDIEMNISHKFWANNQNQGPNCNRMVALAGAPADYPEAAPWGARGLTGFIDYIGRPPRAIKPPWWP